MAARNGGWARGGTARSETGASPLARTAATLASACALTALLAGAALSQDTASQDTAAQDTASRDASSQDIATADTPSGEASANAEGAAPDAPAWRHAAALSGEPRYPEGFAHFDYVNPDAPKGGRVKLFSPRGFDSFNAFLPRGTPAPGIGLIHDTLMTASIDENDISAQYGLIAEAIRFPADFSSVTFRLDPEARFQDGEPIEADDVVWSFETITELSPQYRFYYRNVTGAEETAPGEVTFTFDESGNRELPYIMGQLPVLARHWWEAESGGERRIDQTRLDEEPVGSGAYRIDLANVDPGKTMTYRRVEDYWATDHPTQRGKNNFDTIAYEVFEEPIVAIEAFKKGAFDWKDVYSAKEWATDYEDFDALAAGRVVREEFPDTSSGLMQAFVPNLRREKFRDQRVRRALNLAFDFETTKKTRFYGQYERGDSFFDRTELASEGLPEGREEAILREVAAEHPGHVPDDVFTRAYENPVGGDAGQLRANLREADRLLREAGWEIVGGKRVKDGETLTLEYLESQPMFEPIVLPWFNNLQRLGIETTYRSVDASQDIERTRARDFDVVTHSFAQSLSPGNEQREYWGSEAADAPGSRNVAGIKDPAVDALIERVIFAPDRDELLAATRALDRLLLSKDYVVPQWVSTTDRTLRWDRFAHPENLNEVTRGFSNGWPTIWWSKEAEGGAADTADAGAADAGAADADASNAGAAGETVQ